MILKSAILTLCLAVLAISCSSPDSPNDVAKKPTFRMLMLSCDTAYWEETIVLNVSELTGEDSLRLFIGTVEAKILKAEGDSLVFLVPVNAVSAKLRLYAGSHEAGGDLWLNIIQHNISLLDPDITSIEDEGYGGDLLAIWGNDLPSRKRDIRILIDSQSCEIEYQDTSVILFRVPTEVRSGLMRIELFGKLKQLVGFQVLSHEEALLHQGLFSRLSIGTSGFIASMLDYTQDGKGGSLETADTREEAFYATTKEFLAKIEWRGDSIIATAKRIDTDFEHWIELRMIVDKNDSRASGMILYHLWDHRFNEWRDFSIEVSRMRWHQEGDDFRLFAYGDDARAQIKSFTFHNMLLDYQIGSKMLELKGFAGLPIFSISLKTF